MSLANLKSWIVQVWRRPMLRNAATLMSGTFLTQLIGVLVSPLLTRIYTQNDFGVFALYTSIVTIVCVFSTGRFEYAIVLPKEDDDAVNLMALSFLSSLLVSAAILLCISMASHPIAEILGTEEIEGWLYLVPVTIMLTCVMQALYYWANRKANFKLMAASRVSVSLVSNTSNIALGLLKAGSGGLIFSRIFGQIASIFVLGKRVAGQIRPALSKIGRSNLRRNLVQYRRFPMFIVPGDLLNTFSTQLFIILFSSCFSTQSLGSYALMQRVLALPAAYVSAAVMDIYRQKASSDYASDNSCRKMLVGTVKYLFLIGIVPFGILFFFSPQLFEFIFGPEWREAGVFAQILSPMYLSGFVISPVSYTLVIAQKQAIDLGLQITILAISIGSIYLGHALENVNAALVALSISRTTINLVFLILSYRYSHAKA